jgi:hypothetical protein
MGWLFMCQHASKRGKRTLTAGADAAPVERFATAETGGVKQKVPRLARNYLLLKTMPFPER